MAQSVALGRRRSVARVLAAAGPKSSPAMSEALAAPAQPTRLLDQAATKRSPRSAGRIRSGPRLRHHQARCVRRTTRAVRSFLSILPRRRPPTLQENQPSPQQGIGQAAPETARDRRAVPARWERGRGGFRLNPVVRGWSAYYRSVVSGRCSPAPSAEGRRRTRPRCARLHGAIGLGQVQKVAAYEPLLLRGGSDDAAIRCTFTTMQQMIRDGRPGEANVFSMPRESGSRGPPRTYVELARRCCGGVPVWCRGWLN